MELKFLVETSARHIHLTQEALDALVDHPEGEHAALSVRKELSQPGQYVSNTRLDIYGPLNPKTNKKGCIKGISILGPLRDHNQVEISGTDARTLKVNAPVRESGDIKGSAPIEIVNPENGKSIELQEGCIIAKRHVHMTPADAEAFGVKNGDIVRVLISGTGRETIFGDTVIRVSPKFHLDMHIDTDESNAAWAGGECYGTIVK
ncbi:MAG: propanediol utilization protein [Bacilli bacterium]|mgnify:CR=1 FL=1|jgi:putative phosphotransacetylase|nr:propanediol utilization protein [Bacilli bacterium]MCH4228758.1 propanediol utilization protein [Bacilli bacterium]MCH4278076.1 propanediol utilization protein [Bacilli bacterium]MCI2055498.1 propanediol utilization protein [Bacilli bacterium]